MLLFAKRCEVCAVKLPGKRMYKNTCDVCGLEFGRITGQLSDSLRLIAETKNPVTGYNRCLFGLELTEDYRPYVNAGLAQFLNGMSFEEQMEYIVQRANYFADEIREKNKKRKYAKKVGIPRLVHYKNLKMPKKGDHFCKACRLETASNEAGYCHKCILMATTTTNEAYDANLPYKEENGLSGEEYLDYLLEEELRKSM